MRRWITFAALTLAVCAHAQNAKPLPTLRSTLLQELRDTHNHKDWFVSAKEATAGLTAEQAAWTDGKGNHSVGQLAYHLVFWNEFNLANFKGGRPTSPANNDDTFTHYDPKQWDATVKKLDEVMTDLENFVEHADDATLANFAPAIAKICEHNAYHIGEMIVVRKQQGSWNPDNGVKS